MAKDLYGYIIEWVDCPQTLLTFERVENAIKAGSCKIVTPNEKEDRRRLVDFTGGYWGVLVVLYAGRSRS